MYACLNFPIPTLSCFLIIDVPRWLYFAVILTALGTNIYKEVSDNNDKLFYNCVYLSIAVIFFVVYLYYLMWPMIRVYYALDISF